MSCLSGGGTVICSVCLGGMMRCPACLEGGGDDDMFCVSGGGGR